jgi:arylsulfatase A-like enzyme
MGKVRNILFIMCDQLRWDYLSCAGHPRLATPHIDRLAAQGVRFANAFVQAPVCGPSRMSYYTGRYVASHGAVWNFVPLPVGELTLGDYLRPLGLRVAVAGKTHMAEDAEGMKRLGLSRASARGTLIAEGGFEPFDRDDGVHPAGWHEPESRYFSYLRAHGYDSANPWHDFANSAAASDGSVLSGWHMRHARLPARVKEEHSETAYMTDRAIEFIAAQGERPWCLHLGYIKPHWPYMAPAPYNDMYGLDDVLPARRSGTELRDPHPVYAAFTRHPESVNFAQDDMRRTVVPTYMGLVKQVDDHLGRLLGVLERSGRMADTLIVLCSDHGDYLGDHHLGEKELFHDTVAKVPLIIVDPDAAADRTRGTTEQRLVEAIDVLPTLLDAVEVVIPDHIVEGRSLLPLIRDRKIAGWRDAVFSEFDYSFRRATREHLGRPVDGCRMFMRRSARWKYIVAEGFRPQLFDLVADPDEFVDLGAEPAYATTRAELDAQLFAWLRGRKLRVTAADDVVTGWTRRSEDAGIKIGLW